MAKAIISRALVRIGEHGIGFTDFLKLFFRVRIVGIAVGMELQRELPVDALEFHLCDRAAHAQHFVVVAFCVRRQNKPSFKIHSPSWCHDRCVIPSAARDLGFSWRRQGPRSLAALGMTGVSVFPQSAVLSTHLQGFFATLTIAGRSRRSLILYPRCNSSSTSWSAASEVSTISIASCTCGSHGSPPAGMARTPSFASVSCNCL